MAKPKIRFKRYGGTEFPDWKLSTFGQYCKTIDLRTSNIDKYPLYSLTIEDGVTPKTDRYTRDYLITKDGEAYKIVPNNAFVYNPMNLRFGALKANHSGLTVCVSGYYDVFEMGQSDTLAFWENYLTTAKMLNYYNRISTGSLIEKKRVYYSDFQNIEKEIPCLEEQQKIADFLSTVDDVIAHSEAEVHNLEQQKRAAMQKIFSREVRFKRDDGTEFPDWERIKFGELYTQVNEKNDGSFGTDKIISVANMYFKTDASIGKDDYLKTYNICRLGDIAFEGNKSKSFSFGRLVENYIGDGIVSHVFIVFRPVKSSHNLDYWKYAINYEPVMGRILAKCTKKSTMMTDLVPADFLNQTICVPHPDEQQKIATFFSGFDEAITYAKQELEKWKDLKKGLLQQMFV